MISFCCPLCSSSPSCTAAPAHAGQHPGVASLRPAARAPAHSLNKTSRCPAGPSSAVTPARRRLGQATVAAAKKGSVVEPQLVILVDPSPPARPAPPSSTPVWQSPVLLCLAAATVLAAVLLKNRDRKAAVVEQPDLDAIDLTITTDPLAFQRSLARTRQAAYITKAVSLRLSGEPGKAYMELTRALNENSVCRRPFISGTVGKGELVALYQLAIRCGEVPPQFATLLQLQEMLGLSQEEAERLELDVIQSPTSFSI